MADERGSGVVSAISGTLMAVVCIWVMAEVCLIGLTQARIDRVSADLARSVSAAQTSGSNPTAILGSRAVLLLGQLDSRASVIEGVSQNEVRVQISVPIRSIVGSSVGWLFGNGTLTSSGFWPLEVP